MDTPDQTSNACREHNGFPEPNRSLHAQHNGVDNRPRIRLAMTKDGPNSPVTTESTQPSVASHAQHSVGVSCVVRHITQLNIHRQTFVGRSSSGLRYADRPRGESKSSGNSRFLKGVLRLRPFTKFLLGCLLLTGCRPSKQSNPPAIPAAFFGISHGPTWPSITTGALGHPATLAWGFIEKLPGIYDFTSYDHFILEARDKGLVDSSGTVNATITFGYTPQFHARDTSRCILIGDRRVCPSPPSDLTSWTNLLHAVINHYNGVTAP